MAVFGKPEAVSGAENYEREQRAKVLLRFLNSSEFSNHKFTEIFSDEQQKRDFIQNLDFENFTQLLNGVNGILRNKDKTTWAMDGEDVQIKQILLGVNYIPPKHEDKPELFKELLQLSQEMVSEGRSLKDVALLLASALNALHAYADGNGRTSRLMYLLLTNDFNTEIQAKLIEALSEDGREVFNANPGIIRWKIVDLLENEAGVPNSNKNPAGIEGLSGIGEIEFSSGVSEPYQEFFTRLYHDDAKFLFLSIFKYFQDNQISADVSWLHTLHGEEGEQNYVTLDVTKISKNLTQGNLTEIFNNYRGLKKQYVKVLMDTIAHPGKEEYQIEPDGAKISIKEYFENQIKEESGKKV